MRTLIVIMEILLILTASGPAFSADLESLAKEGYLVVDETKVVGEFEGCDARTALSFTNGKVLFAALMPIVSPASCLWHIFWKTRVKR